MKTINIHGKQYVEVKERIKYFRENYKDWSLTSELLELTDERCVIKATISNDKDRVLASGIAYETRGSSYINKTSFVENCETSAWGRALGNLGIGVETSIASADEINYAKAQDKTKKSKVEKLTDAKFSAMIVAIGEGKVSVVQEKMNNYKITKKQKQKLNELILEADLKIKGNESNGVLGIIDDLNSIETPVEIKKNNN
tara:strand:+ start:80 stop:679 length:600 start_codon:yes stop_codon:yes gene_type:complete